MNDTQIISLLLLLAIPGCLSQCQQEVKPCPEQPKAQVVFWEVKNTQGEDAYCVAYPLVEEDPRISFVVEPDNELLIPIPLGDYHLIITNVIGEGADRCDRKVFPELGDTIKTRW